jgi:coenzyme F420-0:L-glutamate ligase/coenzyme F420-1:gamma-L-glutamate ligase
MENKIAMRYNVCLYAVPNIPLIQNGDDISQIIYHVATEDSFTFAEKDIIVIAQKIVSKAENAFVKLSEVVPSSKAIELAEKTGRDPRLCQVYLDESTEVIRVKGRMMITRHRLGFEASSSGVDRSNVAAHKDEVVVLLPRDPDASAQRIRTGIYQLTGKDVAVIINDSFGRRDRDGSIGTAIGLAGIHHLEERQQQDLFGNPSNSKIALIDEIAGAASILMGQADEKYPVVVVRGVNYTIDNNASIKNILFI